MPSNLRIKINLLLVLTLLSVLGLYGCGIAAIIYLCYSNISNFLAYIAMAFIAREVGSYSVEGIRHYLLIYHDMAVASQVSVPSPDSESLERVETIEKTDTENTDSSSKSTTYVDTEEKGRNEEGK